MVVGMLLVGGIVATTLLTGGIWAWGKKNAAEIKAKGSAKGLEKYYAKLPWLLGIIFLISILTIVIYFVWLKPKRQVAQAKAQAEIKEIEAGEPEPSQSTEGYK